MSAPLDLNIWDFATSFYQVPAVEGLCLEAQNRFGLDVTALIFALYRAKSGQGFDAAMAAELARTMSAQVVEPLRAARKALKSLPRLVDTAASEPLRQLVKTAELEAERLTLNALTCLPRGVSPLSCEASLVAIVAAYQTSIDPDLNSLLKRLAFAAENM